MNSSYPLPEALTFLVCRELYFRQLPGIGREVTLVAPTINFWSMVFPARISFGVYVELKKCHGTYRPSIEIRNIEDDAICPPHEFDWLQAPDPLLIYYFAESLLVGLPNPGRYDILLLLSGEEVARRQLWVRDPRVGS